MGRPAVSSALGSVWIANIRILGAAPIICTEIKKRPSIMKGGILLFDYNYRIFSWIKLLNNMLHAAFWYCHTTSSIASCHTVKEYSWALTWNNRRHIVVYNYCILVSLRIVYKMFGAVPCNITAFYPLIIHRRMWIIHPVTIVVYQAILIINIV